MMRGFLGHYMDRDMPPPRGIQNCLLTFDDVFLMHMLRNEAFTTRVIKDRAHTVDPGFYDKYKNTCYYYDGITTPEQLDTFREICEIAPP